MAERNNENAKSLIEAALFISARPLMLDDLGKIAGLHSLGHVRHMMEELQKEYAGRGLEIANTPQGWQMQVNSNILPSVAHLTPYSDIPEGCKRTLALIVYKEPLKQSDLVKIQGNKAYAYIKFLEKKALIKAEKYSRTKLLKATKELETYFGEPKERIKEKIARGLDALGKEESGRKVKELIDSKISVLSGVKGLGEFFARMDRPVQSKAARPAPVEKEEIKTGTKLSLPKKTTETKANLNELSVDEFKVKKKGVRQ